MQEKNILKIAVTGIIFYLIATALTTVFNSLFVFANSIIQSESKIVIGGVHIILGILSAIVVIVFYNKLLKNKVPSNATVIISFVLMLLVGIGSLLLSSLSIASSLTGSSLSVFAFHKELNILSTQVVMPLTLFIYFLVKIFRE